MNNSQSRNRDRRGCILVLSMLAVALVAAAVGASIWGAQGFYALLENALPVVFAGLLIVEVVLILKRRW